MDKKNLISTILKMKQQQHDINLRRTRKKIRVPDGRRTRTRIFFRVLLKLISCCCCFIFNILTLDVGWPHFGYALR